MMINVQRGLALLAALAISSGCKKDDGDAPAPAETPRPAEPASAASAATGRIKLLGVTLIPPANAKEIAGGLDHKRYFADDAQALIDISVAPSGCERALDAEWESWQRLQQDPVQAQLNRIVALKRDERGFHVEAFTRTPAEVAANRPEHPIALFFLCGDRASLSLTVSQRSGTLTDAARKVAADVVGSVKFP